MIIGRYVPVFSLVAGAVRFTRSPPLDTGMRNYYYWPHYIRDIPSITTYIFVGMRPRRLELSALDEALVAVEATSTNLFSYLPHLTTALRITTMSFVSISERIASLSDTHKEVLLALPNPPHG